MFEVYIHEAHNGESNPTYPEFAQFDEPRTMEARIEIFEFYRQYIVTKPLVSNPDDTVIIHALIDSINNVWENKYATTPTRGYVIGLDGKIKEDTGFLTGSAHMRRLDAAIEAELANTSIEPIISSKKINLHLYQTSENRITIKGLNDKNTFYSLFKVNGSLLQSGIVNVKKSDISLTNDYGTGVILLKLKGNMNITEPLILK